MIIKQFNPYGKLALKFHYSALEKNAPFIAYFDRATINVHFSVIGPSLFLSLYDHLNMLVMLPLYCSVTSDGFSHLVAT